MPVPVLDGGQITILLIEGLSRRDLSVASRNASPWPARDDRAR